jgi:hypothetical protein
VQLFSDEVSIFQNKVIASAMVIVDSEIYFFYKESMVTIYNPFKLDEIKALIMSPSNPMSAAFVMKDPQRFNRSHIIFQNQNMGLLVRFF